MTEHEDRTERDAFRRLHEQQQAGALIAPSTLVMAARLAAAEDEEQGLRSGRLLPCPNCGDIVSSRLLMSASRGTACPNCYDDLS